MMLRLWPVFGEMGRKNSKKRWYLYCRCSFTIPKLLAMFYYLYRCFVYRFLATGTLEERILQRQSHKKSLSSSIVDQDEGQIVKKFDLAMLKKLFKLEENTYSDTHDNLKVIQRLLWLMTSKFIIEFELK